MKFQKGDKVRCTLTKDSKDTFAVSPDFFGQIGTVISWQESDLKTLREGYGKDPTCVCVRFDDAVSAGWCRTNFVRLTDLQYVFQEGDIVRVIGCYMHGDQCVHVGKSGVFGYYQGESAYIRLDQSFLGDGGLSYFGKKDLELVDRAPKSDEEQCCNADDIYDYLARAVGQRIEINTCAATIEAVEAGNAGPNVVVKFDDPALNDIVLDGGTTLIPKFGESFNKARHIPGQKCNDPDECEYTCFPVDETGEDYFGPCCGYGLELFTNEGEFMAADYCDVISVTKRLNGTLEVLIQHEGEEAHVLNYEPGSYESFCVPASKYRKEYALTENGTVAA